MFIEFFDSIMKPLPRLLQALSSTLFISIVPIFLIYAMNITIFNKKEYRDKFTNYMIAFAVGGLLGDVFFHTIPHMNSHT